MASRTAASEPGQVGNAVTEAVRIGYRHIDCAPIYGNEAEIGEAVQASITAGEVSREELWITSKLWNFNHLRADVVPGLKNTLSDLRLDYLDLFLVHWPVAHKPGVVFPETPTRPSGMPVSASRIKLAITKIWVTRLAVVKR